MHIDRGCSRSHTRSRPPGLQGENGSFGGVAGGAWTNAVTAEDVMAATLERFGQACVLLDGEGCVVRINAPAAAFVGDGVVVCGGGRLRAGERGCDEALQALIVRAIAQGDDVRAIAPVALTRKAGRPLVGRASAVPRDHFGRARAILTLCPLGAPAASAAPFLAQAYGLTPAESRLAWQMAGCSGLVVAAAALRVSVSTARTHLKAVFAKTETRSQAQLASLLASVGLGLGGGVEGAWAAPRAGS